jgi:DNA-binding MarR family transcriptional regulator
LYAAGVKTATGAGPEDSADPALVAARLRATVGELVRATRTADTLGPIPAAVMDLLDRDGPMTTADLAARRQVRHQTMAVTVKELLDSGYLASAPHARDGRKKVLSLTADGRQALDDDRHGRVRRLTEAIERALNDSERRALEQALRLIDRITASVTLDAGPSETAHGPITGNW